MNYYLGKMPGRIQKPVRRAQREFAVRQTLDESGVGIWGDSHTNIVPGLPEGLSALLGVPVYRDSYGGRTSGEMLADIEKRTLRGLSQSVLLIGTNDLGTGIAAEQVIENIRTILAILPGQPRPVCIPPRVGSRLWDAVKETRRQAVNRWLVDTYSLTTVVDDLLGDGTAAPSLRFDTGDGLHLSAGGYGALARAVFDQSFASRPLMARGDLVEAVS